MAPQPFRHNRLASLRNFSFCVVPAFIAYNPRCHLPLQISPAPARHYKRLVLIGRVRGGQPIRTRTGTGPDTASTKHPCLALPCQALPGRASPCRALPCRDRPCPAAPSPALLRLGGFLAITGCRRAFAVYCLHGEPAINRPVIATPDLGTSNAAPLIDRLAIGNRVIVVNNDLR